MAGKALLSRGQSHGMGCGTTHCLHRLLPPDICPFPDIPPSPFRLLLHWISRSTADHHTTYQLLHVTDTLRSFAPMDSASDVLQCSTTHNAPASVPTVLSPFRKACHVHDIENLPPIPSRIGSSDKGDAHELQLCIFDMGLEDPDEEDERELFDSIPGSDEFLNAIDDDEGSAVALLETARSEGTSDGIAGVSQEELDDVSDVEEESDTSDGESPVLPQVSWATITLSSPASQQTKRTWVRGGSSSHTSESSKGKLDDRSVVSDKHLSSIDEYSTSGVEPESESEANFDPDDTGHDTDHDIEHNTGSVLLVDATRPDRVLRRSTRLVGLKRYREDSQEDSEPTHRPPKRRRTTLTAKPRSAHKPSALSRTSSTGAKKKQGRREPAPERSAAQKGRQGSSRAQRLSESVIRECILTDTSDVTCGHSGCTTKLSVRDLGAARAHHKSHYANALKSGSGVGSVKCLWEDCSTQREIPANASALQRHFDNVHLKVQYMCPRRCEKNGALRTFSRSDEIRRHVKDSPCQGLIDDPLPYVMITLC
ncbi:hypothetical protein C8Q79DRAFT_646487 [Trametes meyenii]|nr:hypothetical protein C8Q79DRAFT_646487 [Trametes meyenii]